MSCQPRLKSARWHPRTTPDPSPVPEAIFADREAVHPIVERAGEIWRMKGEGGLCCQTSSIMFLCRLESAEGVAVPWLP